MLALAALVVFVLALLKVHSSVDLTVLGLALLAAHFAFDGLLPSPLSWRRR